jgi:hypothetical protein
VGGQALKRGLKKGVGNPKPLKKGLKEGCGFCEEKVKYLNNSIGIILKTFKKE